MKLRRIFCVILLLAGLYSAAQNLRRINYVIDSLLSHHTVSANILIATDSKPLFYKSVGFTDISTAKPLQRSNTLQVASLSKQFTAYGIMVLQSQGMLQYDSALKKYIPEFPYPGITIRHLLTHTSGLPNFTQQLLPKLDTTHSNGNSELLALLVQLQPPLQSTPGTVFEYADIDYNLLAIAIERISGKSYRSFMWHHVFKPANMRATSAEQVTDVGQIKNERLAIGHIFDSTAQTFVAAHLQPSRNFVFYLGGFYGANSVVSTTFDLHMWHRALTRSLLLNEAQQQEAFLPYTINGVLPKTKTGKPIQYGFGWTISNDEAMGKVIFTGGAYAGFTSYYYRFPDKKLCFAFLSNAETPANSYLRNRILDLLKRDD